MDAPARVVGADVSCFLGRILILVPWGHPISVSPLVDRATLHPALILVLQYLCARARIFGNEMEVPPRIPDT
jgi:hypothetical protein